MMNFKRKPIDGSEPETLDDAQDRRRSWHIDKAINIPTVLGIISALGAVGVAINSVDRRQTIAEQAILALKDADARHEENNKALQLKLDKNSEKLDLINGNQREVMATLARVEKKR